MVSLAEKHGFSNKYVILRTYSAGVHFGTLLDYDPQNKEGLLGNARRLFRWTGALTLSEVSENGFEEAKISIEKDKLLVTQVVEIIPCSEKSEKLLKEHETYVP